MTGTVVLMYHRVADLEHDPFDLAVHPDRFADQLRRVVRRWEVVPLSDCQARGRRLRIALTFDDGYADNAQVAAPALAAAGLPATFFVTTDHVEHGTALWWDPLGRALLAADRPWLRLTVSGRSLWLDLRDDPARRGSLSVLHRRLRPLPVPEVWHVVEAVEEALQVARHRPRTGMTPDELRMVAGMDGLQIGAHTRTHAQLGGRPRAEQAGEVLGSVQTLTGVLGGGVGAFAYPYGTPSAVGDIAPELAEQAGCRFAVTTSERPVSRRDRPHLLPRMAVGDWGGPELVARIERLARA